MARPSGNAGQPRMSESQPADTNDTCAGKANNRRVEFIRM
jgi:hypothetical protein